VEDDWERADAARLLAIAEDCGSRRVSEASVAVFNEDCFVLLGMMIHLVAEDRLSAPRITGQQRTVDDPVNVWLNAVPLGLT
jgi:hypothetical protein